MSEKKEIFDYLRNKQKAAEIEAKVNGINLWVLLGAIGFVSWQLVGSVNSDIWGHHETLLRVLMFAQAIYMVNLASGPTGGIRDDVRYSSLRFSEVSAPFLPVIVGLLLLVPPALFFVTIEKTLAAGFLTLFGLVVVIIGILAIASQFDSEKVEAERFPKPSFGNTRKAHITVGIFFIVCFLMVAADQAVALLAQVNLNSAESIRSLGLMATLYLLILVALQRTAQNHALHWTYELETDLLLGSVSPDVALRRIEHRALGSRLQDVMDNFFDNLDRRFGALDASLAECEKLLAPVKDIPAEYRAERTTRIEKASVSPLLDIERLQEDLLEFAQYLKKLGESKPFTTRPGIATLLQSLAARQKVYADRAIAAKAKIGALVQNASL